MLASIIKLLFRRKEDKKARPTDVRPTDVRPTEGWKKACPLKEDEKQTEQPTLEERLCRLQEHMDQVKKGSPEWEKLNTRFHMLQEKWEKKNSPDGLSTEQRRRHRESQEERIRKGRDEED